MRRLSLWLALALVALPLVALALQDGNGTSYSSSYPVPVGAGAAAISLREATDQVSLGTSASGCLNAGTTASSASVTAGTWRLLVLSETVAVCMAPDANCDAGVIDLVPGTQMDVVVASANVGTWYCRSTGGTGFVSLRKVN